MSAEITELDLSSWFSTYGLLTAQRILERFKINLENEEIIAAIKNPRSLYYQLLRIPLKNIFNGIILQQAQDYQIYAQKLFIDYLLSPAGSKEEQEGSGSTTREDLEAERLKLMALGEAFNKQELAHQNLISESQGHLIKVAASLQHLFQDIAKKIQTVLKAQQIVKDEALIQKALRSAMVHYDKIDQETLAVSSNFWKTITEILEVDLSNEIRQTLATVLSEVGDPREGVNNILSVYLEQTEDIGINFRSYRSQFYDVILRAIELISLIPDYHIDQERDAENRSSLYFDAHIGD
jgi:hypothetical protein